MIRTSLAVAVVGAVAVFVGFVVTAMFGAVDPLRADIAAALTPMQRETLGPLDFVVIDGVPTGGARVVQLAFFGLLAGGVPAALIATGLNAATRRAKRHWRVGWDAVFQAGLVFQVSSLIVSVGLLLCLIVIMLLEDFRDVVSADFREIVSAAAAAGVALLVNAICGVFGIRSWRYLQATAATERPPRITS